jgi:hypothetical protein
MSSSKITELEEENQRYKQLTSIFYKCCPYPTGDPALCFKDEDCLDCWNGELEEQNRRLKNGGKSQC